MGGSHASLDQGFREDVPAQRHEGSEVDKFGSETGGQPDSGSSLVNRNRSLLELKRHPSAVFPMSLV